MGKSQPKDKEVAIEAPPSAAVATSTAVVDYAADAGAGMENTVADSFAIPFLAVLQSNSPQCTDGDAKFMTEARPGMLLNTVTGELYDGKVGALFVPCAYRRTFLHWGPRTGEGSGFKGENTADEIAQMRATRAIVEFENRLYAPLADGSVNTKRCDRFSDTRLHYGIVTQDGVDGQSVLISLNSTQIKKSKQLMSALSSARISTADGRKVMPPTFAHLVRVTTVPESNDEGNWFGVKFTLESLVKSNELYAAARKLHETVMKGQVSANYETADGSAARGESSGDGF